MTWAKLLFNFCDTYSNAKFGVHKSKGGTRQHTLVRTPQCTSKMALMWKARKQVWREVDIGICGGTIGKGLWSGGGGLGSRWGDWSTIIISPKAHVSWNVIIRRSSEHNIIREHGGWIVFVVLESRLKVVIVFEPATTSKGWQKIFSWFGGNRLNWKKKDIDVSAGGGGLAVENFNSRTRAQSCKCQKWARDWAPPTCPTPSSDSSFPRTTGGGGFYLIAFPDTLFRV